MKEHINEMEKYTDLYPWYWISYGEKCYAFATVEAISMNEGDPIPEPGTELKLDEDSHIGWIGENGTKMLIQRTIAEVEYQDGHIICSFIAAAHSYFFRDKIFNLERKVY